MFIGDDTDKSMVLVFNKYISGYHLEAVAQKVISVFHLYMTKKKKMQNMKQYP